MAAQVGLSGQLDALLIALALPLTLAGLLTSGIQTALVPAYLKARTASGLDDSRRLAGMVLVWVALIGLAMSAVLVVFAGAFIAVAGPGLSAVDRQDAVGYLRVLAPLAFVAAVTAIMYAVCQAEGRFRAMALSTIAGSVVTLTVMLALWGDLGLGALAVANVAGPIVGLAVLFGAAIRAGVVPRPVLHARGMDIRGLLGHAAPLTLGSAILQVNVIADRAIASLIAPGAVSALRYAEVLHPDADQRDQPGLVVRDLSGPRPSGSGNRSRKPCRHHRPDAPVRPGDIHPGDLPDGRGRSGGRVGGLRPGCLRRPPTLR